MAPPFCDSLIRIETWLEPLSATTRSGRRAGEVGHRDPHRVGAHEVAVAVVDRRPELAVAQAGVDQDVVAAAVGDDQVGDAVAVEVGQRHGAGLEQAGGLIGQHGRVAGAVVDDHAIEPLVGVDDVLRAVAGEVGHGQLDGLVGLAIGLEGAVAVADQDQHVAVGVADQQVELAVARQVGDRQPVGFRTARRRWSAAGIRPCRCPGRCSTPSAVSTARSGMPLPVKSAMRTIWAGLCVSMVTGLANRPPPRPASTSSVSEPRIDRHQVGRTARHERPGRPRRPSRPGW